MMGWVPADLGPAYDAATPSHALWLLAPPSSFRTSGEESQPETQMLAVFHKLDLLSGGFQTLKGNQGARKRTGNLKDSPLSDNS